MRARSMIYLNNPVI